MTALVTGAARRLGRAMALALAEDGHDIALHYNGSEAEAQATAAELRALDVRVALLQADLLDWDQTENLMARANDALGPVDLLINNASIFEHDRLGRITRESWDRHLDSNLRAPMQLIQHFVAQLPPAPPVEGEPEAQGLVVNMLDQRMLKPTPEFASYSIAKAGLWWLTRTGAQALAPMVRVNAIAPGPTLQGARQSAAHFAAQRRATLLGRGADCADIVAALRYLVAAKAVTGQMIAVDGGQHLNWQTPDVLGLENA